MKSFVYIITSHAESHHHVGYTQDIERAVKFYEQIPTLFFEGDKKLNRLVYLEEYTNTESTRSRFDELSKSPRTQINEIIKQVNPDLIELKPGINIEL